MIAASDSLHVELRGEGPTVILAHGFSGSARNWGPQVRAFRDRNRLVTYDLRGHARSPSFSELEAACDAESFVQDMLEVVDRSGAARVVVGGLSLGAAVALAFARRHPGRVRGLILASLPAGRNHAGAFSGSAEAMARVLEEEGGEAAGNRFVWGPGSGLDERGAALIRQGFLEHDPIGLARVLRGVLPDLAGEIDAPRLAGEQKIPTLLIAGGRDPGSLATTRRLATRLPHAQTVILEEAGHVVNLVAPTAFNEALGAFLDALPE